MLQVLTDPWLTILSWPGLWLTILSRPGLFVVGWCVNLALRRICRNLSFKFPRLRNDPSWPCVTLSSKQWCFSFSSKADIQTSFKNLILHLPYLKFLLKNQWYVFKNWISSIFWSKNKLKILHWQFNHPLINQSPLYSKSHDRLRSSLCSLPVWSFWKHSSQTRTDLFLRYSKGALLSEQLEHTTWQTKIKLNFK